MLVSIFLPHKKVLFFNTKIFVCLMFIAHLAYENYHKNCWYMLIIFLLLVLPFHFLMLQFISKSSQKPAIVFKSEFLSINIPTST